MDIDRHDDIDQLQLSEESNSRKYKINKQILFNHFRFILKYSS